MIRQGKVWGWTKPLYFGNNTELHEVMIRKDGYCSRHSHTHKANQFYVFTGKLKVIIWKDYGTDTLEDVTILGPGESCVVPPGDEHRFIALEDTHALEIYYVQLSASDIVRKDHGGVYQYAEKADITKQSITPSSQYEGWTGGDGCFIAGRDYSIAGNSSGHSDK